MGGSLEADFCAHTKRHVAGVTKFPRESGESKVGTHIRLLGRPDHPPCVNSPSQRPENIGGFSSKPYRE